MNNTYGYARVSTRDQNEQRQIYALRTLGVLEQNIYSDKISGKDFERPQYKQMLKSLKSGDLLYIKSIDRLGRNYDEILEQWRLLTKTIGIDIVVIDMQLLSFVAENERTNIRQRQAEGIAAAKARGKRFGRSPKPLPPDFDIYYKRWKNGEITGTDAAKACQMPLSSFRYRAKLYEQRGE